MRFTHILPACAFLLTAGLSAQEPPAATLEGEVVDSVTGQPVAGVLLRLDSGPQTLSDEDGRFRLVGLEPGPHMFAVLTHDCRIMWSEVELTPGQVSRVEVRLASAFGTRVEREREQAERRRSEGKLVTAEEIEEMNATSLADVIRRVKPTMIGAPRGTVGAPTSVSGRSRNSFLSATGASEPVVVVNGVRVAHGAQALDFIRPSEVETLELLPGAAAGWEFGSAGSAGVIRVTTRRGDYRALSRSGAEGCVVPDFPVGVRRAPA